jgi:ATP-dependent RNA helicase DHX29
LSVLKKSNRNQTKLEQANQRINELQNEMKICEELYEFDRNEAGEEFRKLIKFKNLDKEVKEILNDEIEKDEHNREQHKAIQIDDDENLFGGLLDNIPGDSFTSSTSNHVSTTIIKDMSFPKATTGRLPKDQLQEFCRKKDDKVTISFVKDETSSSENLYKYSMRIRWSNSENSKEWNMGNVACRNKIEAENYVATLALFELTDLPLYVSFPTCYRELWLELTEEKISAENKAKLAKDQERIKLLIDIAEEKKKENIVSYIKSEIFFFF